MPPKQQEEVEEEEEEEEVPKASMSKCMTWSPCSELFDMFRKY